ncbi:MAG: valine--tRNA ligase [Candidatus Pacearchaeota archaeon]
MKKDKKEIYNFNKVENKWLKYWNKEKIYKFDINSDKPIFSIDTPPPTVSGKLHMGHFFGDSQQDFIARYKRMRGFNVLNPFGTDNNGLPTLKLIEKEKNIKAKDMSREKFINLCYKIIQEEYIPSFISEYQRSGMSADLSLFYSTIDERSKRISQKSFIDLYNKGREYRTNSPALWCVNCQTTIAQVELIDFEKETFFNDLIFKVGNKKVIISTTRPELLPACVCLFVNPDDVRAKELVGKKAKVPLFNFEVPILLDEKVDPNKGSGIVMCCTFGDQTDMEWQKQYDLEIKNAINLDGTMSEISGNYKGLKITEARKKIIEDLKKENILIKQKKVSQVVNVCERCNTPIEFITTKQWFVKYLDLKEEMLKWGDEIKWYPNFMKTRYNNWVNGLKWDWCISRQISFGIPFPVWYCKNCDEIILARIEDLPIDPLESKPPLDKCPNCGYKEFVPEKDIMNTWATSALTPTIIKDILKDTKIYNKIKDKPLSIRRNGHDIITFWDFNTILKSYLHYNQKPWNELLINGWMLGSDGKKMSKSLGNGISPKEVINEWGADVLRYLSSYSKLGEDLSFPENELKSGKKLITKLINATKFIFLNLENYIPIKPKKLEKFDSLFFKKLNQTIQNSTNYFESYEYSKAKYEVEQFFFKDFCDNYLEIIKKRVYNGNPSEKESAKYVLYNSLLNILKMFAPFMPFITEELYQNYFISNEKAKSIHLTFWPIQIEIDEGDLKIYEIFLDVLKDVRQNKSDAQKSMKTIINLYLPIEKLEILNGLLDDLKNVTNAQEILEGDFRVEFLE